MLRTIYDRFGAKNCSGSIPPNLAARVVARPDLFPLPSGSNASLNIYNLTSRVQTAGGFGCVSCLNRGLQS